MKSKPFSTKLPNDLSQVLDAVCARFGYKKSALVEIALREKLEDILDAADLKEAISEETSFHSWVDVKRRLGRSSK